MFEITLIERDGNGNPKTRTDGSVIKRSFVSDRGDMIADFWNRNSHRLVKKKSDKKVELSSKPTIERQKKVSRRFDDGAR